MKRFAILVLLLLLAACDSSGSGEPCPDRQPFEGDPMFSGTWLVEPSEDGTSWYPVEHTADSVYFEGDLTYFEGESFTATLQLDPTVESSWHPTDPESRAVLSGHQVQEYREASCQIVQTRDLGWEVVDSSRAATAYGEEVTLSAP